MRHPAIPEAFPAPERKTTVEPNPAENKLIQARVLIVDDDPILRTQLVRLGSRYVSEVRAAADGAEGLDTWRQWRPDVVVTDIFMPRMTGLEMSSAIKDDDPDAQIIVITSDKDSDSLRQALGIGVERYISKPVDMHLLTDAISKCVRDRQQIDELRLTRQVAALTQALQEQLQEKQRAEEALQKEKAEQRVLITRLEEAHNQLLQSEKMASIGQLAAGVAHEINNPVGFVNSNLGALQHYIGSLLQLVAAYEQHEGDLSAESRAALTSLKRDIDIDYLREDVGNLLSESLDGLQRIKRIVQDLKDFSHVSTTELQWANLEEGLESTLNVVWNELKYKAEIIKDYGRLPEIQCIPSQLNQVFMNLLVNAAQSIPDRGTITLRTRQEGESVYVEISDTGSGIPQQIINRIFDPFFTTKPVGTGTGLGLSITHGIIRKHHGRIDVNSQPGHGTTFRITLPIKQPPAESRSAV
jgi:signal transduction histidine kinase